MGKTIELKREIESANGESKIKTVNVKDEKDICAQDFYDVSFSADGTSKLGAMSGTIANLCGLTDFQVASLHPKDYIALSGEVSHFLE